MVGTSDAEVRRLLRQHALFRPACERAWRRAGVSAGMRVLDVGAGPGAASRDLASLVGVEGAVVALERNRRFLARCQAEAAELPQLSVRQGDVLHDPLPHGPFDLIWCRWVAVFLEDGARLLERLVLGGEPAVAEWLADVMALMGPALVQQRRWPLRRRPPAALDAGEAALTRHSRNQPGRFQLRDEAKGGGVAESIGEQHPIQVVALVLHHPGMKALHATIHELAIAIEAPVAQPLPARHAAPQPRHTQATLPAHFALGAQGGELGIDQQGAGQGWRIGIAGVGPTAAEQHHPQRHADLGSSQACAAAGRHRVVQIRDQLPQRRIAQISHRPGPLSQTGITETNHRTNGHQPSGSPEGAQTTSTTKFSLLSSEDSTATGARTLPIRVIGLRWRLRRLEIQSE